MCRVQDEDKSDVYDIGVILLEIIIGRPITSQNEVVIAKNILVSVYTPKINQNLLLELV